MPVLSADLLWATKLPQPDSQNRIFTSVLAAVCASVLLCVCVCMSTFKSQTYPQFDQKAKTKRKKKSSGLKHFSVSLKCHR